MTNNAPPPKSMPIMSPGVLLLAVEKTTSPMRINKIEMPIRGIIMGPATKSVIIPIVFARVSGAS